MRKFLLALLAIALTSCDPSASPSASSPEGEGTVAIQINLSPVGYLGRSFSMKPRRLILAFRSSNDKAFLDTIAIAGANPAFLSYKLATGVEWKLALSVFDQNDSLLYTGSKTFRVFASDLQTLRISAEARYSRLQLAFPLPDSVSRARVRVDGQVWVDSSIHPGTPRDDTIRINRDYLAASVEGVVHRFELQVRGRRKGIDTLLYALDTVLSIHSGWKERHVLKLRWVGPDSAPHASGSTDLQLGTVGQTRITATYGNTSALSSTEYDFGVPWLPLAYDTFRDPRDGAVYRAIEINGRTWMAEDLRYAGPDGTVGRCIAEHSDSCLKYGRMYRWSEAMAIDAKYDTSWLDTSSRHQNVPDLRIQGICPPGWMVPALADIKALLRPYDVAGQLKSSGGWADVRTDLAGSGTDAFGFRALPAGSIDAKGKFATGKTFLSHTGSEMGAKSLRVQVISHSNGTWMNGSISKTSSIPVRCFQP
jgi:uncharacterized protein (TIGR02145 family)